MLPGDGPDRSRDPPDAQPGPAPARGRPRPAHERELLRADLAAGATERLDLVLDETLRLWPPAWVGPHESLRATTIAGVEIPAHAPVNYCSWASHRLPDVWEAPDAFVPDRFSPARRAAIPKGAYVPFGGGSRTCIGMRCGQAEIRAIVTRILAGFDVELQPGLRLRVSPTPTLGMADGMPVRLQTAA